MIPCYCYEVRDGTYVGPCANIHAILSYLTFFSLTFPGLEEFNTDRSKCQEHFDVYKECKKKEVLESLTLSISSIVLGCIF
jgi:hypothetical protein